MFLYIRRSLKRQLKMHRNIFIILTCVFILPLMFSILHDSILYGQQAQFFNETQGAHYRVYDAKEEYLPYFQELKSFDCWYDDGSIFLFIKNAKNREEFENLPLHQPPTALQSSLSDEISATEARLGWATRTIDLSGLHMQRKEDAQFAVQLRYGIVIILLLSIGIAQAAYRIHVGNFTHDLGVLTSLGATMRHIAGMFAAELALQFVAAGALALLVSCAGMGALFYFFLENTNSSHQWMLFHIDIRSIAIVYAALLLVLVVVFGITMLMLRRKAPQGLLGTEARKGKHQRSKHSFVPGQPPAPALARLLRRSGKGLTASAAIALPILIISIFFFNYASVATRYGPTNLEYDLYISKSGLDPTTGEGLSFTDEELKFFVGLEEVERLGYKKRVSATEYVLKYDGDLVNTFATFDFFDRTFLMTSISRISEATAASSKEAKTWNTGEGHIVINKNQPYLNLQQGDMLSLYPYAATMRAMIQGTISSDEWIAVGQPITLTVGGLVDSRYYEDTVEIFLSDADYDAMLAHLPANVAMLKVRADADYDAFVKMMEEKFSSSTYGIGNNRLAVQITHQRTTGLYLLVEIVVVMLLFFVVVIVNSLLRGYMQGQRGNIRLLHILGAPHAMIRAAYMRQSIVVAITTLAVSFAAGIGITRLYYAQQAIHVRVTVLLVVTYVLAALAVLFAFLYPIHSELNDELKQL